MASEDAEADVSFVVSALDDTSINLGAANLSLNDPLDLETLADFEDEVSLVNELLAIEAEGEADVDGKEANFPLVELDVKLARLLGILEHACSDTSASVERVIDEISRTVPRLTFDLQLMRENVVLLRYTLDSIRKRSVKATALDETSQVMRRLKVLDTIKTRMEAARDVLREAEAWSTLESEVTGLVSEQAYVKAAERLSEASKSMVVFQNTPEYEARRSLMVSLQNGLEAGLSASLVSAINARDIQACQNFHAIFGQIQREAEFQNYYFGSRRAHLVKEWQAAVLSDCSTAVVDLATSSTRSIPTTFSNFLPSFYAELEKTVNEERTFITAIFPDPLETLSAFLQTVFDSLVPSFPQRISDLSNSHGPRLLVELIKIYHETEAFAVATDQIFMRLNESIRPVMASPAALATDAPFSTPLKGGALSPLTPGTSARNPQQQRSRRQSKSMSISRRASRGGMASHNQASHHSHSAAPSPSVAGLPNDSFHNEANRQWESNLFEPFLDWQAEYADLESRLLKSEVARITSNQDVMAHMLSSVSRTSDEPSQSERKSFSTRQGAKALLDQTLAVFALADDALGRTMAFTHGYGAAGFVEAIDGTFKTFLLKERDTILRAKDAHAGRRRKSAIKEDINIDLTQEDWETVQIALRLLDTCRTIWQRISSLETKIKARLVDVASLLRDARQDPAAQVIPGTTRGALLLLWQSTLNSASLVSLLDTVEQSQGPQTSPLPPLLAQARSATIELTRTSQLFLHDTVIAPLMQTLQTYARLPDWTVDAENLDGARGAFDLHIPSFSISPSETITRIGEGLLNLVGMLETYAEDDALGFAIDLLPGLDDEMVSTLRTEHSTKVLVSASAILSPIAHHGLGGRSRPSVSLANNEFLSGPGSSHEMTVPQSVPRVSPAASQSHHSSANGSAASESLPAELVISTWLSSLTRSVLIYLTSDVLPSIPALTRHGADQLASDLSYLSNHARALDVELEQLEKWISALEITSPKQTRSVGEADDVSAGDNEVVEVVRRMRAHPIVTRQRQ